MTCSAQRRGRHALSASLGFTFTTLSFLSGVANAADPTFDFFADSPSARLALVPTHLQPPSTMGADLDGMYEIDGTENFAPLRDGDVAAMEPASEKAEELTLLADAIADLKSELKELEESVDEVAEKAGNKSIVVSGTKKSTMKISGRVHLDAWGFDHDDNIDAIAENGTDEANRFEFRRLRFGVAGDIKDNMIYKIEMEFGGGNDSEFRDAFLGWTELPVFQTLLLGNQKRPYGLDHLNSSRYNVFLERPFVIEAFNEDARRVGLQAYGVSADESWNWRYGGFTGRNIQDEGEYVGDHLQLEFAGRLANTIWYDEASDGRRYAHWAVAGTHSDVTSNVDPDEGAVAESRFRTRPEARTAGERWLDTGIIEGADFYNLIALEGVINVGALQIVGEYQNNWVDRGDLETVNLNGGYVYASYFLTGEHMPWDRSSGTLGRVKPFKNFWFVNKCGDCKEAAGWGAWQIAARYSVTDFSDENIAGGEADALTIGLNWHWNENSRMQFNYITGTIDDRTNLIGSGDYDIFGARFMVDF